MAEGRDKVRPQAGRACADARRDNVRPQARRACTAARRGNVQPPAGRAHTAARRTAGGRDKVRPQAGRTCEQSMLSSYPASIVCLRAKHGSRPKYAFGERIHARRTCLMPPFLRAERGGRMGVGGGLKKKTRITTKARCTHLWRHSELLS